MCYATGIPLRIVEDPVMKRFFFQESLSIFKLPSRNLIGGPLQEATYKKRKENIVKQLKQQQYLALFTKGWSDTNNSSIVNFVLVSPTMKPVFWSSIAIGEDEHSGKYIAECIDRVIDEVKVAIGSKGICAVVTNNAKKHEVGMGASEGEEALCLLQRLCSTWLQFANESRHED
ncbi:hypothetical protein PPTG_15041 [Phytophthora nicotianae INRA-310]|uniref:DUF659 domain-containing protein n=1 Tax=Phytophthora nicotianae (strain INRA-310) TaxID=761204 RepID=W2PWI0_PHYN3|nr:hypothetical protein PPTG_15041 [Phytophthora nicotianae INRA-310]ETN04365.1 hypothetical protein PPTG_15041 [Phytophthora nicotianae INRA-310]